MDFLERLYRNTDLDEKFLEVRILPSGKQYWYSDLTRLDEWEGKPDVYFGVGLRHTRKGSRDAVDQLPAVWADVDIKDFASEQEAKRTLWEGAPTGAGSWSTIIKTGGGFHAYALLSEPAIGTDIGRVERINRGLAAAIGADRNACDAARILRLPGTFNAKYSPARAVEIVHQSDVEFGSLDDFWMYEEKAPEVEQNITAITDIEEINELVRRCPFIRWTVENAEHLPEWAWYAMISNVCGLRGSPDWIHQVSRPYPGYSKTETDKKILHALNGSAPISCNWIKSQGYDCGKVCGVKSPVGLLWKQADVKRSEQKKGEDRSQIIVDLIERAIPNKGWLHDYMEYSMPMTDAPTIFHLFTGLATLSATAGRTYWMQGWGGEQLFPNLWMILIAPSSKYRKSTVISTARDLMRNAGLAIMPESFSKEQLITELTNRNQVSFIWPEFGDALATMGKDYMSGTKELFAHLYDCPHIYERKLRQESFTIKDPYLTILGGSPVEWLADKGLNKDIRGGFFARFLYVPAHRKTWTVDMPPAPNQMMRRKLLNGMRDVVFSEPKEFSFKNVMDRSKLFEKELEDLATVSEYSMELAAAYSRLQVTAFKLAMLFALSRGQQGGEILPDDMERAICCAKAARFATEDIIRSIPMDKDDQIIVQITAKMMHLHEQGQEWISTSDLIRQTHKPKNKLQEALDTMETMGRVAVTYSETGKKGRRATYYKLIFE